MGDSGSYGKAPEPGSAREEAERLVAAALAVARSAASEARDRAGALGPLGQVISDVLDQTGVVPRPSRPGATAHGTAPAEDPASRADDAAAEDGRPADDPASRAEGGPAPGDHPGRPGGEVPPRSGRAGAGTAFGAGFATGDPECCVCPVCRSIAALRDPSPEFAERLATGAGDFAAGVASLLRALSSVTNPARHRTGEARTGGASAEDDTTGDPWAAATHSASADPSDRPAPRSPDAPAAPSGEAPETRSGEVPEGRWGEAPETRSGEAPEAPSSDAPSPWRDSVWREATSTRHDSWPADEPDDVWAAATRAEAGTWETGTTTGPDRATPAGAEQPRPAASPATGRPPVPASRTPEGPVATGSGEQTAPGEDG